MDAKYELKVIVPLGAKILDQPRPEAKGAHKRRDDPVGTKLQATDILIIEGVPYGELIPRDPQKPEYVRISEAGGLVKDQVTGKVTQFDGVLTYCQVKNLVTTAPASDLVSALQQHTTALQNNTSALTLMTVAIRDMAGK